MRLAILTIALSALPAGAQTYNWINASGGTFSTPGNWNPVGPPGAAHDASFTIAANYTVSLTAPATVNSLGVSTGNLTFSLGGFTLTTTAASNTYVLSSSSATFFGGTLNFGSFSVGTSPGSNSSATFSSSLAANIGNSFQIGGNGNGTMSVISGADVVANNVSLGSSFSSTTGTGIVNVSGTGSTWTTNGTFRIGEYGVGNFSALNGALVNGASLEIGAFPGANGSVTVGGNNAAFTISGTANFGGFLATNPGNSATLNLNTGGVANFNGTLNLRSVAAINLNGGFLNVNNFSYQPGATVNWTAGTLQFANAGTLTADVVQLFLNGSGTLGANRTLKANAGTATLTTPLVVAGTLNLPDTNLDASLIIQPLGKFISSGIITLNAAQTLQVDNLGTLHSDMAIFNNGGTVTLGGPAAVVTGFTANNFGIVQGTGRFIGGLNNGTGGYIRALAGHHLIIDQVGTTNPGNIELLGGTLEYTKVLSNLANGFISGRGEFRGGTSSPGGNGLSNQGVVALSAGTTDIRGDVINSSAGKIVVAGGGVLTFYDDVIHNGSEIRTQMGARSVFFGAQSGAGPFTGTGIVEYSGDLRPGNSPALVTHEGTVILNSTAKYIVELGGLTPGSGYDRLQIAGGVLLGGNLQVNLINGFVPDVGQQFTIIDYTNTSPVDGTFNGLAENAILSSGDTYFTISYAGGTGNDVVLTVTPLPEPVWLGILATGVLLAIRRGRA